MAVGWLCGFLNLVRYLTTVGLSLIGNLQASLAKSNLNRMSRAEVFPLGKNILYYSIIQCRLSISLLFLQISTYHGQTKASWLSEGEQSVRRILIIFTVNAADGGISTRPLLQNLIRRDPASYQEEFLLQYRHYGAQRDIFVSIPMSTPISGDKFEAGKFSELIDFIAHVSSCYPMHTKTFPDDLANMLANHATLHPELREKLVQSLVLLRNKYIISSPDLLKVLFPILTTTKSKALRAQIYTTIISEMRNANAEAKNHTLNKTVQTVLFGLVEAGKEDSSSTAGLWAVKITRELWKRSVWGDGRTVEIMKEAALSRNPKVLVGAVKFFLGVDQEREEVLEGGNSDDDGLSKHVENLRKGAGISKTNKKKRQLEKAVATLKRVCPSIFMLFDGPLQLIPNDVHTQ